MTSPPAFRPLLAVLLATAGLLVGDGGGVYAQTAGPVTSAPSFGIGVVDAAIAEASLRFGVPEQWIRAMIRVESAGRVRAVSRAGAMGLMQVMPATYAALRRRYGLGPDPFDVRDNILAGTAYLRQMHDRYGRTGMLAAYNAGPGRWEEYSRRARPLPLETVAYVARLAPMIGARGLSMQAAVQVANAPAAPPQLIFVTPAGTSHAAAVLPVVQASANEPAAPERFESVFVRRTPADRQQSDHSTANASSAAFGALFAPVSGSGGDQ